MISVHICINGIPIVARSAVNRGPVPSGVTRYELDDGTSVLHKPEDGAVVLGIKMLGQIREQGTDPMKIARAKDGALR